MNAKVSMDVCISPNIAFVFSGFTSLKLTPVERDKTHKNFSQNKTVLQTGLCVLNHSTKSIYTTRPVCGWEMRS